MLLSVHSYVVISIYNVNPNRIVVSNKVPFGKKDLKYFIGNIYDDEKVMSLFIMLPKMSAYRKDFDGTKYMSFLIKGNKLSENYKEIWDQVSKLIKRGFDSESVYNQKYLKTKIKSCMGKTNANFHNDKMPKEGSQCFCVSVILIESVSEMGKKYYFKCF